jgi:hypothetical protein
MLPRWGWKKALSGLDILARRSPAELTADVNESVDDAQVKEVMLDSANQSISALKASLAATRAEAVAAQNRARLAEVEGKRGDDIDVDEIHRLR